MAMSSITLISSSLSLKDFGDPDRGVLGDTAPRCGLSFIGVSGALMLADVPESLLNSRFLEEGESKTVGDTTEDVRS